MVCSAENLETKDKVAIKKITKAFSNLIETKRTLREVKLLRHFQHANIIQVLDIMKPESFAKFEDVYIVSELMVSVISCWHCPLYHTMSNARTHICEILPLSLSHALSLSPLSEH